MSPWALAEETIKFPLQHARRNFATSLVTPEGTENMTRSVVSSTSQSVERFNAAIFGLSFVRG